MAERNTCRIGLEPVDIAQIFMIFSALPMLLRDRPRLHLLGAGHATYRQDASLSSGILRMS